MTNYPEILRSLGIRLVCAAITGGIAWFILSHASGGWEATPVLLLGMGLMVSTAIMLAPPVARLLAEPTGGLFYPMQRFDRPQPAYGIPQSLRKRERFRESLEAYRKVAEEFPDQRQVYIEMIDLAILDLRDGALAQTIRQQGLARLTKPEDREALETMYKAIASRLAPPDARLTATLHRRP